MIGARSNVRTQGVRSNHPTQPQESGAPRTVLATTPAEFFAVAFNDENGRQQRMVVLRVEGKVYVPPGSIEWAQGLKPAADWLAEAVNRMGGERVEAPLDPNTLPPDETDVLPPDEQSNGGMDVPATEGDNAVPAEG